MKKVLTYCVFFIVVVMLGLFLATPERYSYRDFCNILEQEGIDYEKSYQNVNADFISKYSNLDKSISDKEQIPAINHMIYVFGAKEQRSIHKALLARMVRSAERLNTVHDKWQHYFWTNFPDSVPKEIQNIRNLKIMDIRELQEHALYPDIVDRINSVELKRFVQNSDILRFIIMERYGGVYHDCDSEIFRAQDLHKLMMNFDLILGQEDNNFKRPNQVVDKKHPLNAIAGGFMAAMPHHKMIQHTIELMMRNLHQEEAKSVPNYVKYPKNSNYKILFETGPALVTVAYFQYVETAKENGWSNRSIVLPPMALYNAELARAQRPYHEHCPPQSDNPQDFGFYESHKINTIAGDLFCGRWQN